MARFRFYETALLFPPFRAATEGMGGERLTPRRFNSERWRRSPSPRTRNCGQVISDNLLRFLDHSSNDFSCRQY
jgi:hypothetical protein